MRFDTLGHSWGENYFHPVLTGFREADQSCLRWETCSAVARRLFTTRPAVADRPEAEDSAISGIDDPFRPAFHRGERK